MGDKAMRPSKHPMDPHDTSRLHQHINNIVNYIIRMIAWTKYFDNFEWLMQQMSSHERYRNVMPS